MDGNRKMKTREMRMEDIDALREFHEHYFADQFSFPDFIHTFMTAFVITDDEDNILVGGGVRPMAEAVIVTDIDAPRIKVGRALNEAHKVCKYICARFGHQHLHTFVTNRHYERHLRMRGYTSIKGTALVLDVNHG